MAELADALDSKSSCRKTVRVRVPPLVLVKTVATLASFSRFFFACNRRECRLSEKLWDGALLLNRQADIHRPIMIDVVAVSV